MLRLLRIPALMLKELEAGTYDQAATALALTTALGKTLDTLADHHLNFGYSAEPSPLGFEPAPTVEELASERESQREDGYGIKGVERLEGNVGVLRIDRFPHPEIAGEALAAAMRLLDGTDALIVDLRENRGGDSDTVLLLASWFFRPDPIHLNDSIERKETRQRWTVEWLPVRRYTKPVYVVTSGRTYSGGEALTYTLQAMHRGRVIGERTRGGAHLARWYSIHANFAVQIPWARNVYPATGGDWEGVGVKPDLEAPAATARAVAYRQALEERIASAPEEDKDTLREVLKGLDDASKD
jgi:C-terminal processing protease CtpA/Prc